MARRPELPFVRGSRTSKAAAESFGPGVVLADWRAIYQAILSAGLVGLTDDEIEYRLGLRHQTASARRRDLVKKHKLIEDSGRTRPTSSGRQAIVWVAIRRAKEEGWTS